jgi:hypothetical protein
MPTNGKNPESETPRARMSGYRAVNFGSSSRCVEAVWGSLVVNPDKLRREG